jgi:hypothetical protein
MQDVGRVTVRRVGGGGVRAGEEKGKVGLGEG